MFWKKKNFTARLFGRHRNGTHLQDPNNKLDIVRHNVNYFNCTEDTKHSLESVKMRFCSKLDLSICGLLITTILFFLPGVIFLVLGFKCVGRNNSAPDKTTPASCAMVDNETIIILFVFGTLFVFVGVLVCAFAFIVHRANAIGKRQEGN